MNPLGIDIDQGCSDYNTDEISFFETSQQADEGIAIFCFFFVLSMPYHNITTYSMSVKYVGIISKKLRLFPCIGSLNLKLGTCAKSASYVINFEGF